MTTKILKIVSVISFLSFIFYFLYNANLPFVGPFGNNNATYSLQAKNYLQFGLWRTKLAPVNEVKDGKFQYYLHHPPLLQLLTALSYKIFGQNSWWPGRFFPIVSTLASIILMVAVANQIWGKKEKWLTLFFASTSPFLFSFGKIIQFEPLLLCITLFFTYLAIKNSSHKLTFPLILLIVTGCLIDWPMIIFLLAVYLVGITSKSYKFHMHVHIGFVVLVLFFAYASLLVGPKELISAFFGRSLGSELFGQLWALPKLIFLLLLRIIIYFTPLSFASAIYLLLKRKTDKISLIYLAFGGLNVLLFLNGAYAHPYWLYYLTPFFLFSSVSLTKKIFDQKKWLWLGIILLITNTIFSVLVVRYKDQQVKKALWQNVFIDQITPLLTKDEEIGTSWDFNEELFRYKTGHPIKILWLKEEIFKDTLEEPKWHYFIFSCWANCNPKDAKIGETLLEKYNLALKEKENRAFLLDLTKPKKGTDQREASGETMIKKESYSSLLWQYYRKMRDWLGVNQI